MPETLNEHEITMTRTFDAPRELERPSRLAFGGTIENHPGLTSSSTAVTFTDLGDGRTEVALTHTMVCSDEMPEMARSGWTQGLEQLAAVLASAS